jgi:hypothetical protein
MSSTEALLGSIAEAALNDHFQKWRQIAHSTAGIDRDQAKEAIYHLYRQSHSAPPSLIIWLESPIQGALALALLQNSLRVGGSASVGPHSCEPSIANYYRMLEEELQKQLQKRNDATFWSTARGHLQELLLNSYGHVAALISRSMRTKLIERARQQPSTGLIDSVDGRMNIGQEVRQETGLVPLHPEDAGTPFEELLNQLMVALMSQLPADHQKAVLPLTRDEAYLSPIYYSAISSLPYAHQGSLDILIPFYDFCRQSGLNLSGIEASAMLASSCGWVWPIGNICVMTARPKTLITDRAGRLHNERGSCLSYTDGWDLQAVHGIVVPPRMISFLREPTLAAIASERNIETRRMMLDTYGVERFLRETGAEKVQSDDCGALYVRQSSFRPEPVVFVCVRNSTPEPDGHYRQYFIRVPPHTRTAREGVAWTFGLSPDEYKPWRET